MPNRSLVNQHTPGPWFANTHTGRVTNGNDRCVLASYHFDEQQREINARLIASVPEILETLQACIRAHKTGRYEPINAAIIAAENLIEVLEENDV